MYYRLEGLPLHFTRNLTQYVNEQFSADGSYVAVSKIGHRGHRHSLRQISISGDDLKDMVYKSKVDSRGELHQRILALMASRYIFCSKTRLDMLTGLRWPL